jgi:hypothetical protein
MGLDTKTYWLTDRQSQCEFDFDLTCGQSLDKANHDTGNIKGLNMAVVKHTTVQVTRLPL